eukprot:TRINITY_DN3016_c0_g1_i1.p1 TRINITY_DN3016_c0_g1~~TRINITY_DN3016_c0_g1_i1.p1  ORF type:complete len:132 (-),score=4.72 TRINITY_DN3016_c0_g1_i1:287-682(-)
MCLPCLAGYLDMCALCPLHYQRGGGVRLQKNMKFHSHSSELAIVVVAVGILEENKSAPQDGSSPRRGLDRDRQKAAIEGIATLGFPNTCILHAAWNHSLSGDNFFHLSYNKLRPRPLFDSLYYVTYSSSGV